MHPIVSRYKKLEWLESNDNIETKDLNWLFNSITEYKTLNITTSSEFQFSNDVESARIDKIEHPWNNYLNCWIQEMVLSDNPLREMVALFWHHQIPSQVGHKHEHAELLLEIYRKYGLDSAPQLVKAIAANPAMLYYLDGHWSHKSEPNENFPRELFEIFLLGEGYYTLHDVKEAARAFTGRRFDHEKYPYNLYIDETAQDQGTKTLLGKSGNFNGDDVIDLAFSQKQCAKHLSKAIIKFFLTDNPPETLVSQCADFYYENNYHTLSLLKFLFQHPLIVNNSFPKKVKTPLELLVYFQRETGYRTVGPKTNNFFLLKTGQILFKPHNVSGWPSGEKWLFGEQLLHRLFLPSALVQIANRQSSKQSIQFKLSSRLSHANLRELRFVLDGKFDFDKFTNALLKENIKPSLWLLGKDLPTQSFDLDTLLAIIQDPNYQYC